MNTETTYSILRWQTESGARRDVDVLAVEEPLQIQLDTRPISVTMRTPGHDEELAAGFLLSEGIIQNRADLLKDMPVWKHAQGNLISLFLAPDVSVDFARLTRHVFASSSCGLCGKATIDAVQLKFPPVTCDLSIPSNLLLSLPDKLREAQPVFSQTGGLHAAAIFSCDGNLVVVREDVGRHNALDKVLGYGLLNDRLPFDRHVLLVSGRTSFEIVQKALAARIPIIASVSAPSSLAVQFAEANRQTLVGFLRAGRMNVYTSP